jgi:4-hydroxy-tetrahydrodipicolinate synthase
VAGLKETETLTDTLEGVFAAVLTPLDHKGDPDIGLFVLHCRWLLANGCDGLSVLGTTGEANSLSVDERLRLLDALAEAAIPGALLLPGTGCCAIPDTVRLSAKAIEIGAGAVLMLPPFYYKNVGDDGLFAAYSEVIERLGDPRLRIVLYHFPQMSGIPLTSTLIERLRRRYPDTVLGMKDSSGDGAAMIAASRAFPGFSVFTGSDEFLLPLLEAGGAGCITAVCNVASSIAADVLNAVRRGDRAAAADHQQRLDAIRKAIVAYPLAAALKSLIARHTGDARWQNLRPPLLPLPAADAAALETALDRIGFALSPRTA